MTDQTTHIPGSSRGLGGMPKAQARKAVTRTAAVVTLAWVVIIGVYYTVPVGRYGGVSDFLRLGFGLVLFGVVLAFETRQIFRSDTPGLKAIQTLGIVIPLFLVIFSVIYLAMSHEAIHNFSQQLDHTRAIYFTVTTFATVGYGDITPTTDLARIIVSIQMILDLVLIGALVRFLVFAAERGLSLRTRRSTDGG